MGKYLFFRKKMVHVVRSQCFNNSNEGIIHDSLHKATQKGAALICPLLCCYTLPNEGLLQR